MEIPLTYRPSISTLPRGHTSGGALSKWVGARGREEYNTMCGYPKSLTFKVTLAVCSDLV